MDFTNTHLNWGTNPHLASNDLVHILKSSMSSQHGMRTMDVLFLHNLCTNHHHLSHLSL
jgi:hypothetical protein